MVNVPFRLENKRATSRAALKAPGLPGAVNATAQAIARRASAKTGDEIVVEPHKRRDRHGAYVTRLGSGARGEASDRALGSSL